MSTPSRSDANLMLVKEENVCDMDEYHTIFEKLKKLRNIASTNDFPADPGTSKSKNKLAPKRKPDLDLDVLSDDSALNYTRKTKRRRFSDSQDYTEIGYFDVRDFSPPKNKMYVISLSNLPGEWTYDKIKQYVTDECGVNVLKMTDSRADKTDYQLRLRFSSEEQYENVLSKLKGKEVEGKLKVYGSDLDDSDSSTSDSTFIIEKSNIKKEDNSSKLDADDWDPEGLYGLTPEFLLSLNVTPPLVKWIHVANFRCDKSELRDVFEIAGRIVSCSVVHTKNKYAKIMYSHPLEAVQAISMLNDQIFYGQSLKVTLDPHAEKAIPLPKGLQNYGPGLGVSGKPLREVVREFERFVTGKTSSINSQLFFSSGKLRSLEPYVPSKLSSSSTTLGQFGLIGQKKSSTLSTSNDNIISNNSKNTNNDPFVNSPRPGPSNTASYDPRLQNNSSMFSTNMIPATPPIAGPISGPNIRPPLPSPNIPSSSFASNVPGSKDPNFQGPPGFNIQNQPDASFQCRPSPQFQGHNLNYQSPLGPNQRSVLQGQTRPNFPGAGPSYSGPGPNYQGSFNRGPNLPNQGGPNFQGPGQFANRFDVNAPFNQRGPIYNMNGPAAPKMFGPGQNNLSVGTRPVLPPMPMGPNGPVEKGILVLKSQDPVTLKITNLPPTVTFTSLCSKLSKVGQVISLEFTTPGRAVVKFGNPSEAERCFHYYSPARFGNELGR